MSLEERIHVSEMENGTVSLVCIEYIFEDWPQLELCRLCSVNGDARDEGGRDALQAMQPQAVSHKDR